ncbi:MAG: ABC transporter ATP-binding protein [Cyanobacteria bacterium P01_D01_bin.6]
MRNKIKKTRRQSASLISLILGLWQYLSQRRKRQFLLLAVLMISSSFLDVITLSAVIPFLQVLTEPEQLFNYRLVQSISQVLGISSANQLILPITLLFTLCTIIAAGGRLLFLWCNTRLSYAAGADLSVQAYQRTLYQPYQVHVARNSSEVISGMNKIGIAVTVFYSLLTFLSALILITLVLLTLIVINPWVACFALLVFGTSYVLVTKVSRRQLSRNSQRIAYEATQVLKALQEGLGGIRDVLLDNSQSMYCDIYRRSDIPLRYASGRNVFIASSPAPFMEALGIVIITFIAYGLTYTSNGVSNALPVLGALALGAKRLLPALHQAYASWASISGNKASLMDVLALLEQPLPKWIAEPTPLPLKFESSICFEDITFRYGDSGPMLLSGLSFTVKKGMRVAFVGATGSGKSTTLDLMMGLLSPLKGSILIDGRVLDEQQLRAWQRNISHVPQNIFLTDATFSENIALGVSVDNIDLEQVQFAARQAKIADFIESQPKGYRTLIGERGIRISGGQRQRIGIARALYKKSSVLVFDEATSALDNSTERAVMDSINELDRNLTILLIAHRLTTVEHCDLIFELDQGRIVAQGTYEELLNVSPSFQKMVGTSYR